LLPDPEVLVPPRVFIIGLVALVLVVANVLGSASGRRAGTTFLATSDSNGTARLTTRNPKRGPSVIEVLQPWAILLGVIPLCGRLNDNHLISSRSKAMAGRRPLLRQLGSDKKVRSGAAIRRFAFQAASGVSLFLRQ